MGREEMVAVGDGFNDLSMIQFAGLGVAMANAQEVVKQHADFITLSNEEDGVAAVVDRFFLDSFLTGGKERICGLSPITGQQGHSCPDDYDTRGVVQTLKICATPLVLDGTLPLRFLIVLFRLSRNPMGTVVSFACFGVAGRLLPRKCQKASGQ